MLNKPGDLATVQSLRGAIRQCRDEDGIDSLEYLFPVFGLFHLRMAFISMIYLNHHGGTTFKEFSHLNAIIEKLGLHGFKDTKMHNFRAVEDLLEQAYVLYISAWICELFPPPVGTMLSQKERRNLAASMGKKMAFDQVIVPCITPYIQLQERSSGSRSLPLVGPCSTSCLILCGPWRYTGN